MAYNEQTGNFKAGKLKTGTGSKVTNRKQAIAIMMAEKRKNAQNPLKGLKDVGKLAKGTPAGPGGLFDLDDMPGRDTNQDGIFGKPVKTAKKRKLVGFHALKGLKDARK